MDPIKSKTEGLRTSGRAIFTVEEIEVMGLRRSIDNLKREFCTLLEPILEFEDEVNKLSDGMSAELRKRPHRDGNWIFKGIQVDVDKFIEKLNEIRKHPKEGIKFTELTRRGYLRAWEKRLFELIVIMKTMIEEQYYKRLWEIIHPRHM